jgi:acetolactate synthase small subunit
MNPQTILLALTIIEFAANKAVALAEYKAIVEVARAEGRDVSDEELKAMADRNKVKLDAVLQLLGV